MEQEIDLREYIDVFLRRWKVIAYIAVGMAAVSLTYSLFQDPVYEAKTTILVRSGSSSPLSQFADLARVVGKSSGSDGIMGDLMQVLQSRAVAARVVMDLDLRKRIKGWDDPEIKEEQLASTIQGLLRKPKAKGNLLELEVQYSDPVLTAEIVNGFVQALSYYWNGLNYTEVQKKRQYIEGQLPRVEKELGSAEKRIKSFTRLGVTQPSVELQRIQREYKIQDGIYTMLRKEYESVKLDESKEIPPFSVVDKALIPKNPIKPSVKMNALVGLILGLFSGSFVAFFQEYWEETGKQS